jgi:hypothetical protein
MDAFIIITAPNAITISSMIVVLNSPMNAVNATSAIITKSAILSALNAITSSATKKAATFKIHYSVTYWQGGSRSSEPPCHLYGINGGNTIIGLHHNSREDYTLNSI